MAQPTVLIVPGLRDHVAEHWQTLLAARLPRVRTVVPMGRENLDCAARVAAIDRELMSISGPVIVVAHSGGVIMLAHWAAWPRRTLRRVHGALLATPPDFEQPMPAGYPDIEALRENGWPPLPFPSIGAASRHDPLGSFERVQELALAWCSRIVDLGEVGHLNPASGYGEWPSAQSLIDELAAGETKYTAARAA